MIHENCFDNYCKLYHFSTYSCSTTNNLKEKCFCVDDIIIIIVYRVTLEEENKPINVFMDIFNGWSEEESRSVLSRMNMNICDTLLLGVCMDNLNKWSGEKMDYFVQDEKHFFRHAFVFRSKNNWMNTCSPCKISWIDKLVCY